MRKSIFLLSAVFGIGTASAQDHIVKTDSTRIEARVMEVTPAEVRYKVFTRQSGPTYVLPVGQIGYIRYEDGFVELYANAQPAATATAAVEPAAQPTTAAIETVAASEAATPVVTTATPEVTITEAPVITQRAPMPNEGVTYNAYPDYTRVPRRAHYEVGQFYDCNGVKGIVCYVDETKEHGLVVSLDEVMIEWSTHRKKAVVEVGASHRTDGAENMRAVERYIADHNASWEEFPAFKWCRDKGEGWYLPSIDELLTIGNNYNGGTRLRNDRAARSWFNEQLKENGGERMNGKCYYHSSTEVNARLALMSHMGLEIPFVINADDQSEEVPKYGRFLIRAVHKF